MMKICTIFLFSLVRYACSQYAMANLKPISSCEGPGKNALVEQFFNVIFSEFHNAPPNCVCVQMCAAQSIYCYPNGCLKKGDAAKKVDYTPQTVAHIQNINKKPYIMLVGDKNDFMTDLLRKHYVDDSNNIMQTEKTVLQIIRPDPFKDKYKMLYKYKKMPKVELRYNLREQVKNMKSDLLKIETIDVSKTRWPLKKHSVLKGPKTHSEIQMKKIPINSKFFMATLTENNAGDYPPRYFKRDVKKYLEGDYINTKADVRHNPESAPENTSFSLETLIDNLIESNIDMNNTEIHANIVNISKENESNKTEAPTENINETLTSVANGTTNIISMNLTNENFDKDKYLGNSNTTNYTNAFNEMISLSKRIEKQNNASLEIMARVDGNINFVYMNQSTATLPTYKNNIKNDVSPPFLIPQNNEDTTNQTDLEAQTSLPTSTDFVATKKNRQTIWRNQQNSKTN